LSLDACGIFPTRNEEDASIAVYFRTDELRDAFVEAYMEKRVGVQTIRLMSMGGFSTTMEDWEHAHVLPNEIRDLLYPTSWSTAIELYQGDQAVGLLWMIGSPQHDSEPPAREVVQSIGQLASLALQQTVGRAWAMSDQDEFHLLTEEYTRWAMDYFSTDEQLDESERFFADRDGPLMYADPAQLPTVEEPSKRWLLRNDIRFFVQIPLRYGDEHLGTLRITSTFSENETWERLRVFTALASHIAAILKSVRLYDEVQEANANLTTSHHATVRTLAYAAEARDPFTGDHLKNIEAYTTALAAELKLLPEEAEALRFGAILHDVGKLRVPDSILLKPGKLDEKEWDVIRQHPLYGEEILVHSNIPQVSLQIARWHHERWDGGGYPDGISGDEIPLAVQMVTVADVFDALTSARPYKHAWPADKALQEIAAHSGQQFSPQVVEAFHALFEQGVVREILASKIASPVVYPGKQAAA
jgi:putative nucleotidyltransferase with HDIG domain